MTLYQFVKKYNISKTLFLVYFIFFALIIYFSFFIFFGQKGLIKYFSLKSEISEQNLQKKGLENKIKEKKIKVEGMKPESLDLDLLDEEARKNLGYSSKKEIIIYEQDKKNDQDNSK